MALRVEPPAAIGEDPAALIRFAIEHKSGIDIIERLAALQDKRKAEASKAAYDTALAAFQAECPVIVKRKAGQKDMYKYAPLDHILSAKNAEGLEVKQLLKAHGFSYSLTSEIEQGWVKAICKITHSQGHFECTEFKCPIDDNQRNAMSTPQRYGASMTFTKRYAFCNGFGILTADEDTDGAADRPKPQGPSTQAGDKVGARELGKELWHLLKPICGTDTTWQSRNQFLWDEAIISDTEQAQSLTVARYQEVIPKARAKLAAQKKP